MAIVSAQITSSVAPGQELPPAYGPLAFEQRVERTFPGALDYRGTAGLATLEFSALPGLSGAIAWVLDASTAISPAIRDAMLRYTIEQDTDPFFDRYRVRVWLAGEFDNELSGTYPSSYDISPGAIVALPLTAGMVLAIAGALSLLGIAGAIAYSIINVDWQVIAEEQGTWLVIGGVAVAALGVFLLAGRR
jgi:hypothetical protein